MQAKNTSLGTLNSDDYAVCTFDAVKPRVRE